MSWAYWWAYFGAAWAIALSPGSGAVLSISYGSTYGVRGASAGVWGLQAGLLFILLVAGLGVGSLLMASETAFTVVKVLGALYLVYLGVQQWRSTRGMLDNDAAVNAVSLSAKQRFMAGLLTNVTNPKGIVFMVAVLPQFIEPTRPLGLQLLVLSVTTIAVDVVVMHGYALFGRTLRGLLRSPRAVRWQNHVFGAVFIALGALLLLVQRAQPVAAN